MPSKLHIYCSHESVGPGDGRQLSKCLKVFNIKVGELTGDAQMTKQQISETQIIVMTQKNTMSLHAK